MDPNRVGDDASSNPDPNGIEFNHRTFFKMLCKTLCPTACPQQISGVLRNTLYSISHCGTFNIQDLFLRNLVDAAKVHLAMKLYAPWIQKLINMTQGKRYICHHGPKYFTPPVRDTLKVFKDNDKGKSIGIKEKNVVLTNPKNPLLYEVCICTH